MQRNRLQGQLLSHNAHTPAGLRSRRLFSALLLPLVLAGHAWAGGIELPSLPAPEHWEAIFTYCQEMQGGFDADGLPVVLRHPIEPPTPADPDAPPPPTFDPDADAARKASNGDKTREMSFLSWLGTEYAEPGETVLVAGVDSNGVYVLSEHGSSSRALKRYNMDTGRAEWITPPDAPQDLIAPVFLYNADGTPRLAGLTWNTPEGPRTEWNDPALSSAQSRLEKAYPGTGFEWMAAAPDGARWIVRTLRPDRPSDWLCVDTSVLSWQILAECPVPVSPTIRTLFRWTASDGTALSGVFTRPDAPGPFPLVVFPHGGPGASSTTAFDERAWALAVAGFAVFQPNYRGSSGLGKAFRFAGWGPGGIRRSLLDVHEGAAALLSDPANELLPVPPVLLGGSWGGYMALAELALFPGDWSGAVSFFGAFDLPELIRAECARLAADASPSDALHARQSLRRQFGAPEVPADRAALDNLSPALHAEDIRAPVILFHNRADRVIPFAQSERMAAALARAQKPFLFRADDGAHGWSPAEESALYASQAALFRGWVAPEGGPVN